MCTVAEGARGEVVERGTFAIRGRVEARATGYAGWIELDGMDRLRVALDPERACSPVTIDGAPAGELCRDPANQ